MSFTPRPDSFLVLSGPKPADRTGNTPPSIDSLSGFVSEVQPPAVVTPAIVTPAIVAPVVAGAPMVAVPAAPDAAKVGSAATTSTKPRPPLRQKRNSLAGSVITPRTLAAACSAFIAVAAASAVIITLLGGPDRPSANAPSTNVPPTSQAVTPALPPPSLTGPALPPDPRRAANAVTPDPPPQSSPVVATTNRAVGTTGRPTAPNQAARTSRATAASYRGSLSIGSAPQGARVFVNGAPVGSTPLVLDNLPVGSRAVRIEAEGYQRWSASTRVVANKQTRLSATLARAKR